MDPHTGVLPRLKVMVDRATRWKFSWQQSPLAACPQEVKDGVEDGTKVCGARSPTRSCRRQNRRNKSPRRVGQVRVVESRVHRTVPLARFSALSRQTSTFQIHSKAAVSRQGLRAIKNHTATVSRLCEHCHKPVIKPANVSAFLSVGAVNIIFRSGRGVDLRPLRMERTHATIYSFLSCRRFDGNS